MLLNHGQNERYKHKYIGINGRLDALQAAILLVKLKYFPAEIKQRKDIGNRYTKLLSDSNIITPYIKNDRTSVYAQYSIRVQNRDKIIEKLNMLGIPTAVHYPMPLHLQKCFEYLGYKNGDFPISENISKEIMSLPMSPYLEKNDQDIIVKELL